MKLLSALVVLQTLLIAVLLWKIMELSVPVVSAGPVTIPAANIEQPTQSASTSPATEQQADLTESQIRRIIRQELATVLNDLNTNSALGGQADAGDPIGPAEYQRRLDLAQGQLDYFVEQGNISSADMADLQSNIARLDPKSRQYLLNLLSRAISSGDLEGHF